MCGFLFVFFSLISASAAMSQCFPPNWVKADQVKVSCNDTQIALYCDPGLSCQNVSKPGVSLEMGSDEVCLTITNCSYHSSSCEAQSYIDGKEYRTNFTPNVPCNLSAAGGKSQAFSSTSPLLLNTSLSSSTARGTATTVSAAAGKSQAFSSTSPLLLNTSLSSSTARGTATTVSAAGGSVEAVWVQIIGWIILGLIIGWIILRRIIGWIILGLIICYKKLKCFRKAIRDFFCHLPCMNRAPEEEQDIELGEEGKKFLESLNHSAK